MNKYILKLTPPPQLVIIFLTSGLLGLFGSGILV